MDHIGFDEQWRYSNVVRHDTLLFVSGVTGTAADGSVDADPATQFEHAFGRLRADLDAAGARFGDIAEMTTYHVGLRTHLAAFTAVKDRHIMAPYPAWTAIGVSELITVGALVEIRVTASARR